MRVNYLERFAPNILRSSRAVESSHLLDVFHKPEFGGAQPIGGDLEPDRLPLKTEVRSGQVRSAGVKLTAGSSNRIGSRWKQRGQVRSDGVIRWEAQTGPNNAGKKWSISA